MGHILKRLLAAGCGGCEEPRKNMVAKTYPYYLANEPCQPNESLAVLDKYSGEVISRVAMADREAIDTAIARAAEATPAMREMAPFERQQVLQHCVQRFQERHDELAEALCLEAGKPIRDSRAEVTRLIDTFRIAAEESVRMYGEVMPMEISARAKGLRGMWKRVPLGPCSFISPFNFPLNLAAHKVAPALAVGCPFVMKPASRTPLGALMIGRGPRRDKPTEGSVFNSSRQSRWCRSVYRG